MLVQTIQEVRQSAHVVVLGNEKGGSVKSSTALHIAVALLKAGQRVATIDLDSRQQSFTHYIENRRGWAERARIDLEMPTHYCGPRAETSSLDANEAKSSRASLPRSAPSSAATTSW
jgi:chromosome partitioning protein